MGQFLTMGMQRHGRTQSGRVVNGCHHKHNHQPQSRPPTPYPWPGKIAGGYLPQQPC